VSLRNILLPLDLTEQTTHKVDLAIQMAKLFDARLHLVAVSHYFETIRGAGQKLEDRMEEEARRIRSAGIDCSTEQIPHDDVASSVIAYSEEIQADLIFLVTAREGRFDRLFLGSRASRVIGMSTRPVLSIKPASLKGLWEEGS
jgi:nucleotide-binding universal stress UspA family protein